MIFTVIPNASRNGNSINIGRQAVQNNDANGKVIKYHAVRNQFFGSGGVGSAYVFSRRREANHKMGAKPHALCPLHSCSQLARDGLPLVQALIIGSDCDRVELCSLAQEAAAFPGVRGRK